jgi:5-methyltetrahydrofolate--homocysteine methyltransferase
MLIIGERINTSRKKIAEAVEKKDAKFIQAEAVKQVESGAGMLDLNVGTRINTEAEDMEWLVKTVQEATDAPLCLDSPNPKALEVGLKLSKGKSLVNSITAEKERTGTILPLIKKYGAKVVALTMDERGIPEDSSRRVEITGKIVKTLKDYDIPLERVYFDLLVQPLSTNSRNGIIVLESIRNLKESFSSAKVVLGLSNISFGLPQRRLINRTFLAMAVASGLDAVLIDPLDEKIMDMLKAGRALTGEDEYCLEYIQASREEKSFGE